MKTLSNQNISLTKTRYQLGARCELALHNDIMWSYVNKIKPELRTKEQWEIYNTKSISEESLAEKEGIEIGQMIYNHKKFENGILIQDLGNKERTIDQTKRILESNEHVFIFEASFSNPDILNSYIRSDIVEVNTDGTLNLYEAKSSSNEKSNQIEDIAFQKYIIESCGHTVKDCFLAKLNKDYTKNGDIVIEELFEIINVNDKVQVEIENNLDENMKKCAEVMEVYNSVPQKEIGSHCKKGYECPFYDNCTKNIKKDSIHNISQLRQNQRDLLVTMDKRSMRQINLEPTKGTPDYEVFKLLNTRQLRQVENEQTKKDYLNKDIIKAFFTGDTSELCQTENTDWAIINQALYKKAEKTIKDIVKNIIFSHYEYGKTQGETVELDRENSEKILSSIGYDFDEFYETCLSFDYETGGLLASNGRVRSKAFRLFYDNYLCDVIIERRDQLAKDMFKGLKYPLNHLDFEGRNFAIPRYDGMKCYEVYTYQASIHLEKENGELTHSDFLSTKNKDERKELCKYLIKELSKNDGSIIVYYKSYEIGRLKDLQKWFPEYKEQLQGFIDRIVDLDEITKRTWYYTNDFNGSHSIKYVAPHFNKELSYKGMEVSNGFESMEKWQEFIYSSMQKDKKEKREVALREYCKKDTFAMVTLVNGLLKLSDLPYNNFTEDV